MAESAKLIEIGRGRGRGRGRLLAVTENLGEELEEMKLQPTEPTHRGRGRGRGWKLRTEAEIPQISSPEAPRPRSSEIHQPQICFTTEALQLHTDTDLPYYQTNDQGEHLYHQPENVEGLDSESSCSAPTTPSPTAVLKDNNPIHWSDIWKAKHPEMQPEIKLEKQVEVDLWDSSESEFCSDDEAKLKRTNFGHISLKFKDPTNSDDTKVPDGPPNSAADCQLASEFRDDAVLSPEPLVSRFYCSICGLPAGKDTFACITMGHVTCKACQNELELLRCHYVRHLENGMAFCAAPLQEYKSVFRDFIYDNTKVNCINHNNGCKYEAAWEDVKVHQQTCEFKNVV